MSAPAADLELRITTEDVPGGTRLRYVLHSPGGRVGYTHHAIEGPTLRGRPEEFQARMLATVEKLGKGRSSDGALFLTAEVDKELAALGLGLYRELFPKELRIAYGEFRDQITSLLIVSDEPWIPWELIRAPDDDFLCCRFELSRWLAGENRPLGRARRRRPGRLRRGGLRSAVQAAAPRRRGEPAPRRARGGTIPASGAWS